MAHTARQELAIATLDGICPATFHVPDGNGTWPGAILYMDAPGIRPAILEIADRLAASGYAVAVPDLYYRAGRYAPIDPKIVFTNPELRAQHRATFQAAATPENLMADTRAILDAMRTTRGIADGPIGVVGYCMGGRLALIAAGTFPERIAVAASYHGGGLADDKASSPHLLAPRMKAKIYVAGAVEDANFPDGMKARLESALREAGVDHVVETYPARHGWVPRDTPAHDAAQTEHHWQTLIPLFDNVLKRP